MWLIISILGCIFILGECKYHYDIKQRKAHLARLDKLMQERDRYEFRI